MKQSQPDENKNVNSKSDTENRVAELNNKYLRALADYQNLEKQTEDWKREFTKYASSGLVVKLLEILDDLEKAQETIKDDGLTLVVSKFKKVLESEGLEVLELEGKEYDPSLAEVVSMESGDRENIIAKVFQKGYRLQGKIIRPAKVVVSRKE